MFKKGDKIKLIDCPFDEQITGELERYIKLEDKIHIVTKIKDTRKMEGTTGQWVKTNLMPDWTDKSYFYKIKESKGEGYELYIA